MIRPMLLLVASLPLLAQAEDWTTVSTRGGDTWTLDKGSLQTVTVNGKSLKQVQTRARFKEVQEDYGKKFDESRSTELYDCTGKASAIREENLILAGTTVKTRKTADDELEFVDFFPDTAGSDLAKVVCEE